MREQINYQITTYQQHQLVWDLLIEHLTCNDLRTAVSYMPFFLSNATVHIEPKFLKAEDITLMQSAKGLQDITIYQIQTTDGKIIELDEPMRFNSKTKDSRHKPSTKKIFSYSEYFSIKWLLSDLKQLVTNGTIRSSKGEKVYIRQSDISIVKADIVVKKLVFDLPFMTSFPEETSQLTLLDKTYWQTRIIKTIDDFLSMVEPTYEVVRQKVRFPSMNVVIGYNLNNDKRFIKVKTRTSLYTRYFWSLVFKTPTTLSPFGRVKPKLYTHNGDLYIQFPGIYGLIERGSTTLTIDELRLGQL